MISASISLELTEHMKSLTVSKQKKVLEFAKSLETDISDGVPGHLLLQFAGMYSKEDLFEITKATEECRNINHDEW